MHLLFRAGGHKYQLAAWELLNRGVIGVHALSLDEINRMQELMQQYSDSPMDFADASFVATAETLNIERIFTIDSHFHAYKLTNGSALEVIP
jgi:predicted nucleic acid-binding protein